MIGSLDVMAVTASVVTAIGAFMVYWSYRPKGIEMGKHEMQSDVPKDGEVFVDMVDHDVVDTTTGADVVIGRVRTTPSKHDGTQKKR